MDNTIPNMKEKKKKRRRRRRRRRRRSIRKEEDEEERRRRRRRRIRIMRWSRRRRMRRRRRRRLGQTRRAHAARVLLPLWHTHPVQCDRHSISAAFVFRVCLGLAIMPLCHTHLFTTNNFEVFSSKLQAQHATWAIASYLPVMLLWRSASAFSGENDVFERETWGPQRAHSCDSALWSRDVVSIIDCNRGDF